MDVVDLIHRTVEAHKDRQPLPPDVEDWFSTALLRHLQDGSDIGVALGLTGNRSARFTYLTDFRNRLLCEAWFHQAGGPWTKSVNLAARIKRFLSIVWPRTKDMPDVPDYLDEDIQLLWRANRLSHALGSSLPQSARMVRLVCYQMRQEGTLEPEIESLLRMR